MVPNIPKLGRVQPSAYQLLSKKAVTIIDHLLFERCSYSVRQNGEYKDYRTNFKITCITDFTNMCLACEIAGYPICWHSIQNRGSFPHEQLKRQLLPSILYLFTIVVALKPDFKLRENFTFSLHQQTLVSDIQVQIQHFHTKKRGVDQEPTSQIVMVVDFIYLNI